MAQKRERPKGKNTKMTVARMGSDAKQKGRRVSAAVYWKRVTKSQDA